MKKEHNKKVQKGAPRKVRVVVLNLIRVLLIVAFFGAIYNNRNLIVFISALAFIITFLPLIFKKLFNIELPAQFEVIVILFIYGALFFGKVKGFYADFWWWSILLNVTLATAFGFIGLAVMYTLYKGDKIHASPFVIAIFAFCFAVAVGTVWEFFEFSLDYVFGFTLHQSGNTMIDILANMTGALAVSTFGYFYIKNGKVVIISTLISKFIERNPKIFKSKFKTDPSQGIINLIKDGEKENTEFKSTLRTNLHTNQVDKKMEHSILKTVAAYLNTNGGTLLIGVSDTGEVLGLEKDNFVNTDKANLHLNSLIRDNLGGEHLPFVNSEIVNVNDKSILKIDCKKGEKEVFLKNGNEEEFYVRNGPSSVKLTGRALLGYVNHKFKE